MHDPLNQLYRTKIAFLAVMLIIGGLALITLGHWASHQPSWRWLDGWPLNDVGIALFTTGLLGVGLQYFVDEDKELHDTERLKRVLAETAPAMRDAVISGFAFEPDDLARVATPEVLDQIAANSLAIRLGDANFAAELYNDLKQQAIEMPERLHDLRISLRLSPLPAGRGTAEGRASLFEVIAQYEFKAKPVFPTRRFVCLADLDEFRELDRDTATSAWYFAPKGGLEAADPDAFELVDFRVDGEPRKIHRSAKRDSQTYSVSIGLEAVAAREFVDIAYTYRTVTAIDGHRLRLRIDQPTHGLSIVFDYGDTDLQEVFVLDYIASGEMTRVTHSTSELPGKSLTVQFDGWALSRSGIAFVWK